MTDARAATAPHPFAALTPDFVMDALAGLGLIQIPRYDVQGHLQSAELVEVLQAYPPPALPVHVLYLHRAHLSRRVRVFIDWIAQLLVQAGAIAPGPEGM